MCPRCRKMILPAAARIMRITSAMSTLPSPSASPMIEYATFISTLPFMPPTLPVEVYCHILAREGRAEALQFASHIGTPTGDSKRLSSHHEFAYTIGRKPAARTRSQKSFTLAVSAARSPVRCESSTSTAAHS